jgi:hypothetical protein
MTSHSGVRRARPPRSRGDYIQVQEVSHVVQGHAREQWYAYRAHLDAHPTTTPRRPLRFLKKRFRFPDANPSKSFASAAGRCG